MKRTKSNYRFGQSQGFTLLEILVALFIFTILSMMLVGALHNVITIHSRTEDHAERLRELQRALLVFSRDVEQAVNRPVLNTFGRPEAAFVGSPRDFTLTHDGYANPTGAAVQSTLQRSGYSVKDKHLIRFAWYVLDQAPNSKAHERSVLNNVTDVRFEYLDKQGHFHSNWPIAEKKEEALPRAVRVFITIPDWGRMSQLYVISAE